MPAPAGQASACLPSAPAHKYVQMQLPPADRLQLEETPTWSR